MQIGKVTQEDLDYVVGRYDDGIRSTDEMLGGLFTYLEKSGLSKNTVVAIQSEHGEGLGERGYILHYDIYDEQTHTPLIIKIPELNLGRINDLASGVDVMPTLLEILNVQRPRPKAKVLCLAYWEHLLCQEKKFI